MTVVTVGLLPGHAAPLAADLLADRQRRFRDAWQAAAPSFESPSRCLALLEPLLRAGDAFGAWRGSRLVGFVAGTSRERWGVIPAAGHAVDSGDADTAGVYGALYAELAEHWVKRGVLIHDVELPAVREIEDAWNDLGFGRRVYIGLTPISQVDTAEFCGRTAVMVASRPCERWNASSSRISTSATEGRAARSANAELEATRTPEHPEPWPTAMGGTPGSRLTYARWLTYVARGRAADSAPVPMK